MEENQIINSILQAMKVTKNDVRPDFAESISKTNENGIDKVVWARRNDELVASFKNVPHIHVLHIQRSKLWQIDPVFNEETGYLYVQVSNKNLERIISKLKKEKDTTHYLYSFLMKAQDKKPMFGNQLEFELDNASITKSEERREKDIRKMLGELVNKVKDIKIISVTYYADDAIYAELLEYTSNFELSSRVDISNLMPLHYSDNTEKLNKEKERKVNNNNSEQLITLKRNVKIE